MRCILPNNEKKYGNFEEELVLKQLKTSSVISYARFIRFGFSKHIELQQLVDKCKLIEDKLNTARLDRSQFYSKVLLSIGFRLEEFRIGNGVIFFRSNKFELLEKFFCDITSEPNLIPTTKERLTPK